MENLIEFKHSGKRILFLFILVIAMFLLVSVLDVDKTVSYKENRALAGKPAFSFSALFSGEFTKDFETYYSDTFPGRDFFLDVDSKIRKVTSRFVRNDEDVVIFSTEKTGDDFAGESLGDAENN